MEYLLCRILNVIVHKLLPFDERKDQRDLQEISQRLMEAANTIAGSSLEQTTWPQEKRLCQNQCFSNLRIGC